MTKDCNNSDKVLPRSFYKRGTITVAKELLGTYLVTNLPEGRTIGQIVETESYLGATDPAAHSFNGKTKRNAVMFGPAGYAYIYFIYGMYYCINAVTAKAGAGEAVLIRALEPINGIELMQKRRGTKDVTKLCSGPGKLTQAMGITPNLNEADLTSNVIYIMKKYPGKKPEIVATTRIGIKAGSEHPWRFYIKNSPFISRP